MDTSYSPFEIMAVVLARELTNDDTVLVGTAMPMAEAAQRLAGLTHAPNMEIVNSPVRMNVSHLNQFPMPAYFGDRRPMRWAESYWDKGHRFDDVRAWKRYVFFIGGIQVDRFGNTNLIGIGSDYNKLKFRGPGSVGTTTISAHVGRYYIVLNSHNERTFVERCDFISTFGWGEGGADARKRVGLPGGGPKLCVTPLCVMDFDEETKHMRLVSVHPGVTEAEVQAKTSFPLLRKGPVPTTEPPSEEELRVLRTRIDMAGQLRPTA